MAEYIVQDWVSEYESLLQSELKAFANMHENNQEIADALYTIFNERLKYPDLVHSVCNQFHKFYRSNEETLKRFTLQFIPVLVYIYLNGVAIGDKKSCRSVETLLISIYNVEVSTEDGYQKTVSFRMPVLAQASIYHEEKSLHATDLRRWEENSNRDVKWGPMPQIESINAQNRMKVMTALLFAYNQQLSLVQKSALFHLCRLASQIVNQGFSKPGHSHRSSYGNDPNSTVAPKPLPRIPLSSHFLLELVHAIYFAMFNEFGTIAIQTVEDIHNRACYEMFTDLILVTNAVRNSLHANPSGQPSDGPMGLSVALTPATNTVTVSKSMITNASFRTKKLPDDLDMEFLASLPTQQPMTEIRNDYSDVINSDDQTMHKDKKNETKNQRRWKTWGWKYSPGSKTSSIEEEPDSPKKSLSSSKNSSPNASPKNKKSQFKDDQAQLAALRQKKSQSPGKQSVDVRSSAGARLCQTAEDDAYEQSGDEQNSLLGNGRPASIHVIQTAADDIPIQGFKDESHTGLMSITEENNEQSIGARNTSARSSKDSIKPHKALISGFKKSKDKDIKQVSSKNGGVPSETRECAPKVPLRKDKGNNRTSLHLGATGDSGDCEKSPLPIIKSIVMDSTIDFSNSSDGIALQNLLNGGLVEDKKLDSLDSSCVTPESIDSNADQSSGQNSSLAAVDKHPIQISQV